MSANNYLYCTIATAQKILFHELPPYLTVMLAAFYSSTSFET